VRHYVQRTSPGEHDGTWFAASGATVKLSGRADPLSYRDGRKPFYNELVPPSPRRRSVLIVEDDPELRTLYRTALALSGYIVVAVDDGVEALRRIDADLPDLVVLDIGLPRLGGRDVQRELLSHSETSHIPIIAVTGDARGLNSHDFACIIQKPVDLDALVRAVERCWREQ
jgi:CheY-like chemotaxis protein